MSKERLEEIINNLPYSIRHEGNAEKLIEYAKEQAERVQELEETVEVYKTVNKELHLRGRKVRKQNKRYRKYFIKIIETDERLVDKQYFKDIAEQALKEE